MDNTYTLFGFDAETAMLPFTVERVTVGQATNFARENALGSYFITPSTREQFPDYKIIHYPLDGDGRHRRVAQYEWIDRTFTFTQKFPPKGSAIYEEFYGQADPEANEGAG